MNKEFAKIEELTEYYSFGKVIGELLYDHFCGTFEELKTNDIYSKLDYNELLLIIGLWVKNSNERKFLNKDEINKLPKKVFELLNELHKSFLKPIGQNYNNWMPDFKEMFFYSPTNAYDIQYCNLVFYKYIKDRDWIKKNTGLKVDCFREYFLQIKMLINERLNDNHLVECLSLNGQLINLFIINKVKDKQFKKIKGFYKFLDFFSTPLNSISKDELKDISDYNICREKPIIKLSQNKYFVTSTFHLAEAMWESLFYKMVKSDYSTIAGRNRGNFAEEVVYSYLKSTFNHVFKNIRLSQNKHKELTDIDVCVKIKTTLILFMIKSKKLTLLSKKGDLLSVRKDYEKAIRSSFKQGLLAKKQILDGDLNIFKDQEIKNVFNDVKEVYIYTVIMDNYPYLCFQNQLFLDEFNDMPISISIFDLEVLLNYIIDPDEFVRYTKSRYTYLKTLNMYSEIAFLEFFRTNNQNHMQNCDRGLLANDWGQSIDSDFYGKLLKGENRDLCKYLLKCES